MPLLSVLGKPGSSRDLIVSVLSKQRPLSTKEVHVELNRLSVQKLSYQAVHKMLLRLESEGVLIFRDKKFSLDPDWVLSLKRFSVGLESELSKTGSKKVPKKFGAHTELFFDDINDFCVSMAKIFVQMAKTMDLKGNTVAFIRDAWFTLSFSFTDFSLLQKMTDVTPGKIFVLIGHDRPFNQWVKGMYEEAGFFVCINPKADFEKDFGAIGSYYWEVEFSKETRQVIDSIYSRVDNLLDLFKLYAASLVNKPPKVQIKVTIVRNQQMAQFAFEKISDQFPNKKEILQNSPFKPKSR